MSDMTRRAVLAAAPWVAGAAEHQIGMAPNGPLVRSEVPFQGMVAAHDSQQQSLWCWAACISMIMRYYGHPVRQERVVAETLGVVTNQAASSGVMIARALHRDWVDDLGRSFRARLRAVLDVGAGVGTLSNADIIASLRQDRPLVLGARSHAVVLTAIDWVPAAMGPPTIVRGGAFDPWPGVGPRPLRVDELVPATWGGSLTFLADVVVG